MTTAVGNGTILANTIYLFPIYIPQACTLTQMSIFVSGAIALSSVELGLYTNNNGAPDALIRDAGNVATTSTGQKNITSISQVLSAGWVWVAFWASHGNTISVVGTAAGSGAYGMGVVSLSSGNIPYTHVQKALTFSAGNLPSSITSPTLSSNAFPAVALMI
jgi:hypothetical protein